MNISEIHQRLIQQYFNDDISRLRLKKFGEDVDIDFVINQIQGRKKAKEKIPTWADNKELIYPEYLSLEQCSSEQTAVRKADYFKSGSVLDMTGGMGIDACFIAPHVKNYTLIERNEVLCDINKHNFEKLNLHNIQVVCADSIEYLKLQKQHFNYIYLDPARRKESDSDKKTRVFQIEDFRPNVLEILPRLKECSDSIIVKLPPMLDINDLQLKIPEIHKVVCIALKNEVKELLIFIQTEHSKNHTLSKESINILNDNLEEYFSETSENIHPKPSLSSSKKFIYEPNKSILKLQLQDALANKYNLTKLDDFTHFYTAEEILENYPGRIFKIIQELPSKSKNFKKLFPFDKANIISRNHPLKSEEIHQRFRLKSGGDQFILALTELSQKKIYHCSRLK